MATDEDLHNEHYINKKMSLICTKPSRRIIYFNRDKQTEEAEKLEQRENNEANLQKTVNTTAGRVESEFLMPPPTHVRSDSSNNNKSGKLNNSNSREH